MIDLPGLLSNWGKWSDDPAKNSAISQGLLAAGLQMMQSKGKFGNAIGQGGMAGVNQFQQQMQMAGQDKTRELQHKAMQGQLDAQQRAEQQRQARSKALRDAILPASPGMASPNGDYSGDFTAPASLGGFDPQKYFDNLAAAGDDSALDVLPMLNKTQAPIKLGAGDQLLDPKTFKQLAMNPKAADEDALMQRMKAAGIDPTSPQGQALIRGWLTKQATHAPGTQVSVNTGQKGFDNTLKLRGDFRSEPVYKAHQEVQAAHAQIKQALTLASPAGDLAGATKIMKILDPGSVVRESELGMAMAASGLIDRVQNYAQNILKGTKLTPTQRKDFQTLADALHKESAKAYAAKRAEYQGIAKRNELNDTDVVGPEPMEPQGNVIDFGSLP